jgi:hypothetical protein
VFVVVALPEGDPLSVEKTVDVNRRQ